ncbi:uncharacterized protein STEHIDRAFT_157546 [Stereum hirsutum FP-91666 SS1]|uniref:uncharacterized protein n=1 Tax=Stereum hirsutum (strain FP-91666) TaxID=721885 RepID=UPI000444A3B3|nr:uncharacterized protein STEHIDRAFT_157546 [Stereum hirsutum FP-91666 SS1]EIM86023.1 hypothetical protein STEHIDRAFT_157546 [Stereum hirsutum FP-91666 SS1]
MMGLLLVLIKTPDCVQATKVRNESFAAKSSSIFVFSLLDRRITHLSALCPIRQLPSRALKNEYSASAIIDTRSGESDIRRVLKMLCLTQQRSEVASHLAVRGPRCLEEQLTPATFRDATIRAAAMLVLSRKEAHPRRILATPVFQAYAHMGGRKEPSTSRSSNGGICTDTMYSFSQLFCAPRSPSIVRAN